MRRDRKDRAQHLSGTLIFLLVLGHRDSQRHTKASNFLNYLQQQLSCRRPVDLLVHEGERRIRVGENKTRRFCEVSCQHLGEALGTTTRIRLEHREPQCWVHRVSRLKAARFLHNATPGQLRGGGHPRVASRGACTLSTG
eukprot:6205617-Pleurochrysis_carterae.AAC.2